MVYITVYTKTAEGAEMTAVAKLFMNGRSQAVRLPSEFRFEGTEVNVRRDPETGDVILSEIKKEKSWDEFFRIVDALDLPEDFMKDRDQGTPERDDIF
jgi:antitoxin VapB